MNSVISPFFQHQLVVKMYHFQTKKYGAHKASDKYLVKYSANFDRFMEVFQGETGRLQDNQIILEFAVATDETIDMHLKSMIDHLNSFNKLSYELAAIRDEMLADLQQFRYLLTFK